MSDDAVQMLGLPQWQKLPLNSNTKQFEAPVLMSPKAFSRETDRSL